jgi:hypothetical protein
MMGITDPSGRHPFAAGGAVTVGEDDAPVVAVLPAAAKSLGR